MSHTVKIKVEFLSLSALQAAVAKVGGTWIGQGTHKLFESSEVGMAFTLPNWLFPVVLKADGSLAYDDYNGHWGNVKDIDTLKGKYAIEAAREYADQQGWMSEDIDEGLKVYHPDGGELVVRFDGSSEAFGFIGGACADASAGLEQALGKAVERGHKMEYYQNGQQVCVTQ